MKHSAALALALLFGVANAQQPPSQWLRLGRANGAEMSMDLATVSRDGPWVKAWVGEVFDKPQIDAGSKQSYLSKRTLHYFDCRNARIGLKHMTEFRDRNASVPLPGSLSFATDRMVTHDVVPDSIASDMLNKACAAVR